MWSTRFFKLLKPEILALSLKLFLHIHDYALQIKLHPAYIRLYSNLVFARRRKTDSFLGDVPIARRGIHVVVSAKGGFPKIGESYSDHEASICHAITVCMLFATSDGV